MPTLQSIRTKLGKAVFSATHPALKTLMQKVREDRVTYLEPAALQDLVDVALHNEANQIGGIIIEAGCALGGSAIVLAKAKRQSRSIYVYDVFGMIPPPSSRDEQDIHDRYEVITSGESKGIGGDRYYGYEENLYDKVWNSFSNYGVEPVTNQIHLVKGLFEETLKVSQPVSLAHIDCDWYDSVMVCLQQIVPNLAKGGTLVIDDYYSWSGCKTAVDDYFAACKSEFEFVQKSRLHIVKK
jgi:predicted O-methyltransferase YrrM